MSATIDRIEMLGPMGPFGHSICPVCKEHIKEGDMTILITGQYNVYGGMQGDPDEIFVYIHQECVLKALKIINPPLD